MVLGTFGPGVGCGVAGQWSYESNHWARGMQHSASRQTQEGSVMSSTAEPAIDTGTVGTTSASKYEEQAMTSAGARTVLAVTRIVIGLTFVLGLRRQAVKPPRLP